MLKKAAAGVVIVLVILVGALVVLAALYIWWPSFRQDVWQPFKDNADLPDEVVGWSGARSVRLGAAAIEPLLAVLPEL